MGWLFLPHLPVGEGWGGKGLIAISGEPVGELVGGAAQIGIVVER